MIGAFDPLEPEIPVKDWVDDGVDWFIDTFDPILSVFDSTVSWMYDSLSELLATPNFLAMIAVFAVLGWAARTWQFAVVTAAAFYFVAAMGQWESAMQTLSLIAISALIAVVLAIPLGIWAAKSQWMSNLVKPILDFMQTMPAMLYLLPAVFAFGTGQTTGIVATVVFAMPPGARLTELAIRQVDKEVVEAGQAFGSPPGRILRQIQLPLALPTIMAGVNQVILLALSMVVLAGLVGAGGLGQEVVGSVAGLQIGAGVEAGLAVVVLAIYLDRVVAALGDRAPVVKASRVRA